MVEEKDERASAEALRWGVPSLYSFGGVNVDVGPPFGAAEADLVWPAPSRGWQGRGSTCPACLSVSLGPGQVTTRHHLSGAAAATTRDRRTYVFPYILM